MLQVAVTEGLLLRCGNVTLLKYREAFLNGVILCLHPKTCQSFGRGSVNFISREKGEGNFLHK